MIPPRDPFAIPLHCMHCKTWGTAHMTALEDGPDRPGPGVALRSISTGFRLSREGRSSSDTEFRCTHCDEVAG